MCLSEKAVLFAEGCWRKHPSAHPIRRSNAAAAFSGSSVSWYFDSPGAIASLSLYHNIPTSPVLPRVTGILAETLGSRHRVALSFTSYLSSYNNEGGFRLPHASTNTHHLITLNATLHLAPQFNTLIKRIWFIIDNQQKLYQ